MNREQKSVAIAEIAERIDESEAIFAVDYRGISVAQLAELRARLRDADASFKVVKNSLTERAADQAGAESLKELLTGPTALTFVRGDLATAAKAVADFARATQLLPFKGGLMGEAPLDAEQIRELSRLPSREALYGQLVGVVAAPVSGLVRTLSALLGGLAVALGQVREGKEAGAIPAGEPPAGSPAAQEAQAEAPAGEAPEGEAPPAAEPEAEAPAAPQETAAGEGGAEGEAQSETAAQEAADEPQAEAQAAEAEAQAAEAEGAADEAESEAEPAQENDKQAEASAEEQPGDAEANPTKED